jgi:hypothetical protein
MRRRSNRTAKKRQSLLETVAAGYSVTTAAQRAGMSRRSVYDWKGDDPLFAADLRAAYEEGTDRFADALMERALLPDHDALAIFMLKQRDPDRFNQKMVEVRVGGDPNNPIGIEHRSGGEGGAWIYPRAELERPASPVHRVSPVRLDTRPLIEAVVDDQSENRDPDERDPDEPEPVEEWSQQIRLKRRS